MKRKDKTVEVIVFVGLFATAICALFLGNNGAAGCALGFAIMLGFFHLVFSNT